MHDLDHARGSNGTFEGTVGHGGNVATDGHAIPLGSVYQRGESVDRLAYSAPDVALGERLRGRSEDREA